jgi:Na+/melibiose symporter-like transporter
VGLLSDRCLSSYGRRRPFVLVGAVLGITGIFAQDIASMRGLPQLYYVAFAWSMFGLTTAYTAVVGLMADLVPAKQTGTATGTAALQSVLGASSGFLIYSCFPGSNDTRLHMMYMTYIIITVICIVITMVASKEVPLQLSVESSEDIEGKRGCGMKNLHWFAPSIQPVDVISSYWIDPRIHHDFTMVFWSRTL